MDIEIKNVGVCRFCLKTFSSRMIGRHLLACEEKKQRNLEALSSNKTCGQEAKKICTDCDQFYCASCLSEHPCGDGMALPLVNSPRIGGCGYAGKYDFAIPAIG